MDEHTDSQSKREKEMSESAEEYHSKDFQWEDLKNQVENDPSLQYHILPFCSSKQQDEEDEGNEDDSVPKDSQAWQSFHSRHSTGKFFKERRYLLKEFPELLSSGEYVKVLEVGCGNGSTALPILRGNKDAIMYACDCSTEALERAKDFVAATDTVADRFHPFCCDFSTTGFPKWLACMSCREGLLHKQMSCFTDVKKNVKVLSRDTYSSREGSCCIGGVDFITLIFTMSAVPLHRMPKATRECFSVLKPGGLLLFRDYGLYDMSMLRFEPDQRVGFREYMRSDGTRSYFFCLDTLRTLFIDAGFIEVELEYCCIKSVNRRKGKKMQRVWVHGKFQKPFESI